MRFKNHSCGREKSKMEEAKRYMTEAAQRDAFVKILRYEDAVELPRYAILRKYWKPRSG